MISKVMDPFGWGDPAAVQTPNVGRVGQDYLAMVDAYRRGAPDIFSTESTFQPAYTRLGLQTTGQSLFGSDGMPGLLEYLRAASPMLAEAGALGNRMSRAYNVGDVAQFGGSAAGAVRGVNPQASGLLDLLSGQVKTQLAADNQLDPNQVRQVQQSVRSGQAARGLGFGPSDVYQETLQTSGYGDQLRAARQAAAGNVLGLENAYVTAPALGLVSGDSGAGAMGLQALGMGGSFGRGAGPTLFPSNQSYDAFNTAYNAAAAANIASANNQAAALNSY
jgi:hypothetical protein